MKQGGWLLLLALSISAQAEDFSFDFSDYQRSPWEHNGHMQLMAQHNKINQQSLLQPISPYDQDYWRSQGELELAGLYRWQQWSLHGLAKAQASEDRVQSNHDARFYEAYAHYQPSSQWQFQLGKRNLRWGKGYAFNPVAVLERSKDALDPDLAREGFVLAAADWVKSLESGASVSITAAVLPVSENLNADFGQTDQLNYAIKLGAVLGQTDMDLIWRSGASRSQALGLDFSHSLATNWVLHGEALWSEGEKPVLSSSGQVSQQTWQGVNFLLGTRYLTERETTWIVEFYHQASGYQPEQMQTLYDYAQSATPSSLKAKIQFTPYLSPQSMRNYASIRVTQKEPFDWLYWTIGLNVMVNLDDSSAIWVPEALYAGRSDWEFRLRGLVFAGDRHTEYGERQNQQRIEARVKYSF
jgi:hypothetical protein